MFRGPVRRSLAGWGVTWLVLVATLPACAPGEGPADSSSPSAVSSEPSGESVQPVPEQGPPELMSLDPELHLTDAWFGDLDGMVERRYVRALVPYSKTHYFLDGAVQRGLAFEALTEFEQFLNRRLGSKTTRIHVVIVAVRRDEVLPALERGAGDLAAANLTITPERLERVVFGTPFTRDVRELVVTGPGGPSLESLDDLSGQAVYLRRSTSHWQSVEALNPRLVEKGLLPAELVEIDGFLEDEDVLEMVSSGLLPATVVDDHIARFWVDVLPGLRVHDRLAVREGGEIAWALRRGTPQLKSAVDDFAAANQVGTLTANVLLKRYLSSNAWVRNPLAAGDRARFEKVYALFQKYGDRYDFDALLLTALAYQESRLDQSTRSRAGAVGVMQIKPETAADPNVGITGIEELERNIHAGTKYLRFLRDRYFSEPAISDREQTLLTFAAYNAGPTRVAQLRRDAAEMGLDPNVWFGNVEIAASRRVGRETVQYVANIGKYWVAYRLAQRQQEIRGTSGTRTGS